jgi:hypothetical protein
VTEEYLLKRSSAHALTSSCTSVGGAEAFSYYIILYHTSLNSCYSCDHGLSPVTSPPLLLILRPAWVSPDITLSLASLSLILFILILLLLWGDRHFLSLSLSHNLSYTCLLILQLGALLFYNNTPDYER